MQLHELKPKNKPKKRKRIGRGGKRGTYSGKGMKGQKSRAGRTREPAIREYIKRYPKLRGYKFKSKSVNCAVLNIGILNERFEKGEEINPANLVNKKLVRKRQNRIPVVKILGNGEIDKKVFITGCLISKKAKEKVEKAGGKVIV